jgi:hypothetical protein
MPGAGAPLAQNPRADAPLSQSRQGNPSGRPLKRENALRKLKKARKEAEAAL